MVCSNCFCSALEICVLLLQFSCLAFECSAPLLRLMQLLNVLRVRQRCFSVPALPITNNVPCASRFTLRGFKTTSRLSRFAFSLLLDGHHLRIPSVEHCLQLRQVSAEFLRSCLEQLLPFSSFLRLCLDVHVTRLQLSDVLMEIRDIFLFFCDTRFVCRQQALPKLRVFLVLLSHDIRQAQLLLQLPHLWLPLSRAIRSPKVCFNLSGHVRAPSRSGHGACGSKVVQKHRLLRQLGLKMCDFALQVLNPIPGLASLGLLLCPYLALFFQSALQIQPPLL
mmetsp:Transcript_61973/g.164691  ORF Transcript_61973/g.164691 Transcript_61973/m.164691 type:complete len:279 (-) Transcript_61973:128-964(-)